MGLYQVHVPLNKIQVEGGTGARRMELIPGEGGIGTRRVEQDTHTAGYETGNLKYWPVRTGASWRYWSVYCLTNNAYKNR